MATPPLEDDARSAMTLTSAIKPRKRRDPSLAKTIRPHYEIDVASGAT
jgi:hypothetical protein